MNANLRVGISAYVPGDFMEDGVKVTGTIERISGDYVIFAPAGQFKGYSNVDRTFDAATVLPAPIAKRSNCSGVRYDERCAVCGRIGEICNDCETCPRCHG